MGARLALSTQNCLLQSQPNVQGRLLGTVHKVIPPISHVHVNINFPKTINHLLKLLFTVHVVHL